MFLLDLARTYLVGIWLDITDGCCLGSRYDARARDRVSTVQTTGYVAYVRRFQFRVGAGTALPAFARVFNHHGTQ